jgi:hypothetical protein
VEVIYKLLMVAVVLAVLAVHNLLDQLAEMAVLE